MRIALLAATFLLVSQVYAQDAYQRGDAVRLRANDSAWRVFAIPGEVVDLDKTGVYVDGNRLPEFPRSLLTNTSSTVRAARIPDKRFLVIDEAETKRTLNLIWSIVADDELSAR